MNQRGSSRFAYKFQRHLPERMIQGLLFLAASSAVAVTVSIVAILVYESMDFFRYVSLLEFLTDTQWTPLFADPRHGILPLLSGTLMVALIALTVAVPLGILTAIYLSEFAPQRVREVVKPFLELIEGVPGVAFGYFALLFVTPILQNFIPGLPVFNMLSAGIVVGIMVIPYVASVSEDAMRAVPMHLREGSYAMGATRHQTTLRVVVPAAASGIAAGCVLAAARAVGETMVVTIAAGTQPILTWNPLEGSATITAYIVQVSLGDVEHGGVAYRSIFAAGLALMLMTLLFNLIGHLLRKRFREVY